MDMTTYRQNDRNWRRYYKQNKNLNLNKIKNSETGDTTF